MREYARKHPTAGAGLSAWLLIAGRVSWQSIVDVRRTYPHADSVTLASGSTVTVFNIGGNNFRLVVAVHYNTQRIFIRDFLTHAEHDKQTWKGRH